MDPKEIKRKAHALADAGASEEEVEEFVREASGSPEATEEDFSDVEGGGSSKPQRKPRSRTEASVMGAAKGATFGFADEILGGVDAADKYVRGDRNFKDNFNKASKKVRDQFDEGVEDHPGISMAAEVAGSLIAGGPALKGAASASKIGRVARDAATGAVYGGVAGAGNSEGETLGAVAKDAVQGAGLGLVAAPIAAPLAARAGRAVQKVGRSLAGESTLSAHGVVATRAQEKLDDKVAATVGKNLNRDNKSTASLRGEAERMIARGEKDPRMLVDMAGKQTQRLARASRTAPGEDVLSRKLSKRNERQFGQMSKTLDETTGTAKQDVFKLADDVSKTQATESKPLYDAAHARGAVDDVEVAADAQLLEELLPHAKAAAERLAKAQGKSGELTQDGHRTVRYLDYLKQGLDDALEGGPDSGMGSRQKAAIREIKNRMLTKLDEVVPEYGAARNTYAGHAETKEALEMGKTFLKARPEETARSLEGMTNSEQEHWRIGARDALEQLMSHVSSNADLTKRLLSRPDIRAKIRLAHPDNESYIAFLRQASNARNQARTKDFITGGSNTADKLLEVTEMMTGIDKAELAFDVATSPARAGLGFAKRVLGKNRNMREGAVQEGINKAMALSPKDKQFMALLERMDAMAARKAAEGGTQARLAATVGNQSGASSSGRR